MVADGFGADKDGYTFGEAPEGHKPERVLLSGFGDAAHERAGHTGCDKRVVAAEGRVGTELVEDSVSPRVLPEAQGHLVAVFNCE